MQIIILADKYGGGTMVTYAGNDSSAVISVAGRSTYLNYFLSGFASTIFID